MTKPGYDPFSFGQVRLGADGKRAADAPGLEDSLFAPVGGAVDAKDRDTSWDPPPQFEEPMPPTVVVAHDPAPVAKPIAVAPVRETHQGEHAASVARERAVEAPKQPAPRARVAHVGNVATPHEPTRAPGVSFVEAAAPAVAFIVCESAAAWTWLTFDNPVLGSLAALLGLGLSAFAWFAVRR